jgi:hypothetical protein
MTYLCKIDLSIILKSPQSFKWLLTERFPPPKLFVHTLFSLSRVHIWPIVTPPRFHHLVSTGWPIRLTKFLVMWYTKFANRFLAGGSEVENKDAKVLMLFKEEDFFNPPVSRVVHVWAISVTCSPNAESVWYVIFNFPLILLTCWHF